ncbi:DUF1127 domain-containing protein [Paroceanicella profunda]|uniref:DUF1127 domain-containing protein n=1 Tax=Paroceanicella profunda TaxID=2579971 RepID=A0A5B8FXF0_9RHOB|nr:DUF1127 domain-containing protein [Paroceanicella profunda]QDL90773.1 DUF1127 domain-containing protein [Paroceanicella profunda]
MSTTTFASAPATGRLRAAIDAVFDVFASLGEGLSAAHEYERLSRLSDAALAARGLNRETLSQDVFRTFLSR